MGGGGAPCCHLAHPALQGQQGCFLLRGYHHRACLVLVSRLLSPKEGLLPSQSLFSSHPGPIPPALARSYLCCPEAGSSPWMPFFPRAGDRFPGLNPHFLQEAFLDGCLQLIHDGDPSLLCASVSTVCSSYLHSPPTLHTGCPTVLKSGPSIFCSRRLKPQPRALTLLFRSEYPELSP